MAKGLHDGRVGWEAPSNIGLIVLALLYGEGDFGRTICMAVNCGEDTDCTAATSGALLGILKGIEHIEPRWSDPIGTKLKTACLNLDELGNLGSILPKDIYELQRRIERLAHMVLASFSCPVKLGDGPTAVDRNLFCDDPGSLYLGPDTTRFAFDFFDIDVTYVNGIAMEPGAGKKVTFTVRNRYKTPENFTVRIYAPDMDVSPGPLGALHVPEGVWLGNRASISFTFSVKTVTSSCCRAAAEFTTPSHSGVMLVPLHFLHDMTNPFHMEQKGN